MPTPEEILLQYWGYPEFRPMQREIIGSVLDRRNTLAIMPTGGGKSITFQVPAIMSDGLTVVISPLLALMADQVASLRRRGIRAIRLHSGISQGAMLNILEQAKYGAYDLLYVSPERIASALFRQKIQYAPVTLIAVDEAHCISQWGYDFRPEYLRIPDFRSLFPEAPVLALTASATEAVADDIVKNLSLDTDRAPFARFRQSIRRDNLVYVVRTSTDFEAEIQHILSRVPGSAIIYCRTRQRTELLAGILNDMGLRADCYHAGLDRDLRHQRQQAWMKGECRVLCATNAFGMGIDKPDVRVVIHYDIPDSLEAYYQEAGRAGRDNRPAYAVMLAYPDAAQEIEKRPERAFPTREFIRQVYQSIANVYEIGCGSGCGHYFPFRLSQFCGAARLQFGACQAALRVLEWAGYICMHEEHEDASKLHILIPPTDMRAWHQARLDRDPVVNCALRLYPGILTDQVYIDENVLADYTSRTREDVYRHLRELSRQHVVSYIPFKHMPMLELLTERKDADTLPIPDYAYEQRIAVMRGRLKKVTEYINTTECRTVVLARHFGETDISPCGICDNCRQHKN